MTSFQAQNTSPLQEMSSSLLSTLRTRIFGQEEVCRKLLVAFFSGGHVLVEGVPGIAKTLLVVSLAELMAMKVRRIQFTPDLLPTDLIGITFFRPDLQQFVAEKGPICTNILIADEINRAPPKVQSALLEAMAERQITLLKETIPLDPPFFVMATQNPIEQEGTYPLPEAQLDRFMMKLKMDYPSEKEETSVVLHSTIHEAVTPLKPITSKEAILSLQKQIDSIYAKDSLAEYAVSLTRNSRPGALFKEDQILYGASPRASMWLIRAAKASALMEGRNYITPSDIQSFVYDILRHRIIPSYASLAEGKDASFFIKAIVEATPSP